MLTGRWVPRTAKRPEGRPVTTDVRLTGERACAIGTRFLDEPRDFADDVPQVSSLADRRVSVSELLHDCPQRVLDRLRVEAPLNPAGLVLIRVEVGEQLKVGEGFLYSDRVPRGGVGR